MKEWKKKILLAACLAVPVIATYAQDADTRAAIAKYPHENAIVWNHSEHVIIKYEDGEPVAHSVVHEENLLLNSETLSMYRAGYVYHGYFNSMDGLKAATLIPDGDGYRSVRATDMKTTHAESENIFYDDVKETKITFGNLEQYAHTTIDYSTDHRDIHFLPHFYFQGGMPIRKASFSVTAPKSVVVKYILQGSHTDKIKYSKEEGRNDITYTWEVADMPRIKHYEDAPEAPYYVPHVLIYVASYQPRGSDAPVPVLSTVDDLYHFYYPFIRRVNRRPDDSLTALVSSLTKDIRTDCEKAATIYRWVQQHIRYVAFEDSLGGFVPREAAKVCSRRFGDCKDMTSLLVTMCRLAGLDAHFTWIGTRDKPYKYAQVPLPIVTNHMICALHLGDEWIFMDGTDPVIPFGKAPYALQGKEGLIAIDSAHFKVIPVPEAAFASNTTKDSTHLSLAGNGLSGDVEIDYGGYSAWHMDAVMQYIGESDQEKMLRSLTSRGSNKYQQETWSFLPSTEADKSCVLKSTFKLNDYVRNAGKEYYINLNLQRSYEDEYTDKTEREVPTEHKYKNSLRQVVVLDIPKGYHITYLPPDAEEHVNGLWGYSIKYQKSPTQVKLVKEYRLESLYITPAQFAEQNKLVDGLRSQYRESIVLTAN